jgi:hypothetical protein
MKNRSILFLSIFSKQTKNENKQKKRMVDTMGEKKAVSVKGKA